MQRKQPRVPAGQPGGGQFARVACAEEIPAPMNLLSEQIASPQDRLTVYGLYGSSVELEKVHENWRYVPHVSTTKFGLKILHNQPEQDRLDLSCHIILGQAITNMINKKHVTPGEAELMLREISWLADDEIPSQKNPDTDSLKKLAALRTYGVSLSHELQQWLCYLQCNKPIPSPLHNTEQEHFGEAIRTFYENSSNFRLELLERIGVFGSEHDLLTGLKLRRSILKARSLQSHSPTLGEAYALSSVTDHTTLFAELYEELGNYTNDCCFKRLNVGLPNAAGKIHIKELDTDDLACLVISQSFITPPYTNEFYDWIVHRMPAPDAETAGTVLGGLLNEVIETDPTDSMASISQAASIVESICHAIQQSDVETDNYNIDNFRSDILSFLITGRYPAQACYQNLLQAFVSHPKTYAVLKGFNPNNFHRQTITADWHIDNMV